MPVCSRNGCKKDFSDEENNETACRYHPGGPVFHEGLKSWSCCKDVNKPELEFEAFIKIPGCTAGSHAVAEKPKEKPKPVEKAAEVVKAPILVAQATGTTQSTLPVPKQTQDVGKSRSPSPAPPIPVQEEDDPNVPVPEGTKCRRKGCATVFVSDDENRTGDGPGSVCFHHPSPPIFHEGSKGYLCCKRRVLEFDEFLKIEGCTKGRHVFVPKKAEVTAEVLTTCRIDYYQTPHDVHVSVFAKKADKASSLITLEEQKVHLNLVLPDSKRFQKSLNLYGPIDPAQSKYTFFGTKVELALKKSDARSWNMLEHSDQDLGGYNIIFGVGGRTGTVGSKAPILDDANKDDANKVV